MRKRVVGRELRHAEDTQSAAKSLSLPATIISSPSRVGKTWYGAICENALPSRPGTTPGAEIADELVREQRERGLVERDLERAAGAGALALVQRGDHAERRPDAGAEVDQRDARRAPAGRSSSPVTLMIPEAACSSGS